MHFALVNESSNSDLTPSLMTQIASSIEEQTALDFSMAYETLSSIITCFGKLSEVPSIDSIIHLVEYIPEAPNALAYHTIDEKGTPVLRLGVSTILSNNGTLVKGSNSVSCAISHEVLETIEDKYVALWNEWDGIKKVAYEVCDPVEELFYEINGIAVSDFVTPEWFEVDIGQPGIFNKTNTLTSPRTLSPGGYVVFDDNTQQFGPAMSEFRKDQKIKYSRRMSKGGILLNE
jgi:hypothetical protein